MCTPTQNSRHRADRPQEGLVGLQELRVVVETFGTEVDLEISEHVAYDETEENDAGDGHQHLLAQRRTEVPDGLIHGVSEPLPFVWRRHRIRTRRQPVDRGYSGHRIFSMAARLAREHPVLCAVPPSDKRPLTSNNARNRAKRPAKCGFYPAVTHLTSRFRVESSTGGWFGSNRGCRRVLPDCSGRCVGRGRAACRFSARKPGRTGAARGFFRARLSRHLQSRRVLFQRRYPHPHQSPPVPSQTEPHRSHRRRLPASRRRRPLRPLRTVGGSPPFSRDLGPRFHDGR